MQIRVFRSDKGDCSLLKGSGGGKILCDGGIRESFIKHVAPHLATEGLLDLVYVSHVDDDHIGGILALLDDAMAWKVYDFHLGNGETVKAPKVPRPPVINRIWHNAFKDQIGENAGPVEDLLAAMVPVLASFDDHDLAHAAAENLAIVNSNAQAIQVSQRIGGDQLGIPLNEGGKLVMLRRKQLAFSFGTLNLTVIAPFEADVNALRTEWDKWLTANKNIVKRLRSKAKVDADALSDDFDALMTPLGRAPKELDDRSAVTPPNLASIMLLVRDGASSALMTGDGHANDVIKGLEFTGDLNKGGTLHVDVLKVQHHGSEHNMTQEFADRITADHYVFCGNGFAGNPEPEVIDALVASRSKGAGPDRPHTFHFNSSSRSEKGKATRAAHMARIERKVTELGAGNRHLRFAFLGDDDYFDLTVS